MDNISRRSLLSVGLGAGLVAAWPGAAVATSIADDAGLRTVVARGVEEARIETGHSVHVELKGLRPGRECFYRFRTGKHISAVGRTLTSPAPHETPAALAMAFASCSQYEHGYFTAYTRLAEDHPDLVLHLGDYMYENDTTERFRSAAPPRSRRTTRTCRCGPRPCRPGST